MESLSPLSIRLGVGGSLARKKAENLFQVGWVHFKPGQFLFWGSSIVFADSGSELPALWAVTVSRERRSGLQARE